MSTIEERVAALETALASMTAAEKRIVELPAASSVANDDFVALDGVANGSRRFAASNLGGKAEVMTESEWDDLPDSKLTDGKVYALSGVSPSTQDNPLWQKLGFAALDTEADDCSDAINELNTGLTNLFKKVQYSYTYNIDANASLSVSATQLGASAPAGYSAIAMARISTGKLDVIARNFNPSASGNTGMVNLRNIGANAITGGLLEITITYALTSSIN